MDGSSVTASAKSAPPHGPSAQIRPAQIRPAQVRLVEAACARIEAAEGERVTLAELAAGLEVSPWHLQRLFRRLLGVSPRDYAAARRNERFRAELKEHGRVAEATYGAGFGSSSRVYEDAAYSLGMTPGTYAKGGRGAAIVYAIRPSPLGRLLVAATGKGLCFVALDDDEAALLDGLRREFPAAESIARDDAAVGEALDQVLAYLAGETPHLALPLDLRATAFQCRVWNELIAIPYGETRSYREIAQALGLPKGQRAVARACASNPVSLVIPCHRVLRDDGNLGGYRWGVRRKARLLSLEAVADDESQ